MTDAATEHVAARVPERVRDVVKRLARSERRSTSNLVRVLLEEALVARGELKVVA